MCGKNAIWYRDVLRGQAQSVSEDHMVLVPTQKVDEDIITMTVWSFDRYYYECYQHIFLYNKNGTLIAAMIVLLRWCCS